MAPTVHGNATTTKRIGAIEENKNKQSLQVEDGVKNLDDWQIEPSPTLPPFPLKKILLSLDCDPQSPGPFSPRSRLRGDQPRARNRGLGQGEKEASGERRIGAMEGRFSIRTWLGFAIGRWYLGLLPSWRSRMGRATEGGSSLAARNLTRGVAAGGGERGQGKGMDGSYRRREIVISLSSPTTLLRCNREEDVWWSNRTHK
ncbi:hypothetical protein BHE74_00057862 [Ensete ventricosum]|nr:hypothetical protein GW17_00036557 [Ensete ventricosum]RWW37075.1 hypothetical protein BHE74_00057862 [Ensete ventricosum]